LSGFSEHNDDTPSGGAPFRYLENVALSDAAFEAYGNSPAELFTAAAQAMFGVMVRLDQVKPRVERTLTLSHEHLDQLLFDWLAELIYLKDAQAMLFSRFDPTVEGEGPYRLTARLYGEPIDPKRHTLSVDVKAVTYHLFEVAKKGDQWMARVVLDT
jgi:SHS2 domain-containing protein